MTHYQIIINALVAYVFLQHLWLREQKRINVTLADKLRAASEVLSMRAERTK